MERLGHQVPLIAPRYVTPFIKRQKNDAADAEAIEEAALRRTMRYVEPKTQEQQARAIVFRTREQFVNQRTEAIKALRSHLYEFGYIAPQGTGNLPRLEDVIKDPNTDLPQRARDVCRELLDQIAQLTTRINALKKTINIMSRRPRHPAACRQCRVRGRAAPWPSRPSHPLCSSSNGGAILRPGSAWCRGKTRAAASRDSGKPRRWGTASSGAC